MSAKRTIWYIAMLLALATAAAACGSDGETSPVDGAAADQGQSGPTTTSTTQPGVPDEEDATGAIPTDPPENGETGGDDAHDEGAADASSDHHHADDEHHDDEETAAPITNAADGTPEIGTVVDSGETTPPGTYVIDQLGEEWRVTTSEPLFIEGSDQKLMVARVEDWGPAGPNFVLMTPVVGIVPPREVGVHQDHHPIVPDVTVDLPESLDTWFDAVPQVQVVDSGTATVAGEPAAWWQLTVDPAAGDTFHCPLGDNCVGFVVHEDFGVFVLSPTRDFTVWQLAAVPDVIGWVQTVDGEAGDRGRQAMADLLTDLAAA